MASKISILMFVVCYQIVTAQRPTGLPNPLGPGLGSGLGSGLMPPFLGSNWVPSSGSGNWMRPYYTAAAEGWRAYFEQLNQARNQLWNSLNNIPTQNVDLKPPAVETPVQHEVVTTVVRPQVQNDAQAPRPQAAQPTGGRQPAVTIPNVVSGTRPAVPQVAVPQVGTPVANWVGK